MSNSSYPNYNSYSNSNGANYLADAKPSQVFGNTASASGNYNQPRPPAQPNNPPTNQSSYGTIDFKGNAEGYASSQSRPYNRNAVAAAKPGYEEEVEEDVDDDSDNVYDEDQLRFFQDVVDGKRRLDGNDPYWEMKAELSGNLGRLFGQQAKYRGDESYWERPTTYGLGNSAPIIATKFNTASKVADAKEVRGSSATNTLYEMIQNRGVTYDEALKNNNVRSVVDRQMALKDEAKAVVEDEDEDEEEDDYYDEEGDEDDDDKVLGGLLNSTGLSPNLMALLGMEATKVDVPTDWKPPDHAGLDNSDPLVAQARLRTMQNGIAAAGDYGDDGDY